MNFIRAIPRRRLPKNERGDTEFCRRRFVRMHGRQPDPDVVTRLTDLFYRIKTDGTLFDPGYHPDARACTEAWS